MRVLGALQTGHQQGHAFLHVVGFVGELPRQRADTRFHLIGPLAGPFEAANVLFHVVVDFRRACKLPVEPGRVALSGVDNLPDPRLLLIQRIAPMPDRAAYTVDQSLRTSGQGMEMFFNRRELRQRCVGRGRKTFRASHGALQTLQQRFALGMEGVHRFQQRRIRTRIHFVGIGKVAPSGVFDIDRWALIRSGRDRTRQIPGVGAVQVLRRLDRRPSGRCAGSAARTKMSPSRDTDLGPVHRSFEDRVVARHFLSDVAVDPRCLGSVGGN